MECIGIRTDDIVVGNGEGLLQVAHLLEKHLAEYDEELRAGDVVVVSGKLCSVAEGLIYRSADIAPSEPAKAIAAKFVSSFYDNIHKNALFVHVFLTKQSKNARRLRATSH